jgi:hypothetical protein
MPNTGYAIAVKLWVASESQRRRLEFLRLAEQQRGARSGKAPIRQNLAVLCRFHSQQHEDSLPVFCLLCPKSLLHNFFEEG